MIICYSLLFNFLVTLLKMNLQLKYVYCISSVDVPFLFFFMWHIIMLNKIVSYSIFQSCLEVTLCTTNIMVYLYLFLV